MLGEINPRNRNSPKLPYIVLGHSLTYLDMYSIATLTYPASASSDSVFFMDTIVAQNGMVYDRAHGAIVIPQDGIYAVSGSRSGGSGSFGEMWIHRETVPGSRLRHIAGMNASFQQGVSGVTALKAGDKLYIGVWSTGATSAPAEAATSRFSAVMLTPL